MITKFIYVHVLPNVMLSYKFILVCICCYQVVISVPKENVLPGRGAYDKLHEGKSKIVLDS